MSGSILIMTKSLILLGRYDLNTAGSCSLEHLFNETSCYPKLGLCVPMYITCIENPLFMSSTSPSDQFYRSLKYFTH